MSLRFKIFFASPPSPTDIWRLFPPKLTIKDNPWVYGVDGKWLKRGGVVIIHRDVTHKENIYWSLWKSESYWAFTADTEKLLALLKGKLPHGVISDWKGAIVSSIAMYLGNIPHQRCLAHVVRHGKILLPKRSSFKGVRVLREITKQLIRIRNEKEKRSWLTSLIRWEKEYEYMLWEKTIGEGTVKKWWYTHGNLRRAWRLLTDDWKPFFVYLDYPSIPKSNNSLEGLISQAKNKLIDHRGMKTNQQASFLFWYLIFTRVKTEKDLKKLWDEWRKKILAEIPTKKVT